MPQSIDSFHEIPNIIESFPCSLLFFFPPLFSFLSPVRHPRLPTPAAAVFSSCPKRILSKCIVSNHISIVAEENMDCQPIVCPLLKSGPEASSMLRFVSQTPQSFILSLRRYVIPASCLSGKSTQQMHRVEWYHCVSWEKMWMVCPSLQLHSEVSRIRS